MSTQKEPISPRDGAPPLRRGRGLRLSTATTQPEPQKSPAITRRKLSAAQAGPVATDTAQEAAPPAATTDLAQVADQPVIIEQAAPDIAGSVAEAVAHEQSAPDIAGSVAEAVDPIPEAQEPERRKRELRLRKDLLKACKRIARQQNRKLGQVIESAMEEYIQRHGALE